MYESYFLGGDYLLLIIIFTALSFFVQYKLSSKFKKFKNIHLSNGMTGKEIAEKMLLDHGIRNVKVISTKGKLTDHYDPLKKTVNLSESVYNTSNAASAAVAAHECGHAVQHNQSYEWLQLRSKLVPVVSIASNLSMWMIIIGLSLASSNIIGNNLAIAGVIFFGLGTLFSFITLPVEYDASKRALAWLQRKNIVNQREFLISKDALKLSLIHISEPTRPY